MKNKENFSGVFTKTKARDHGLVPGDTLICVRDAGLGHFSEGKEYEVARDGGLKSDQEGPGLYNTYSLFEFQPQEEEWE